RATVSPGGAAPSPGGATSGGAAASRGAAGRPPPRGGGPPGTGGREGGGARPGDALSIPPYFFPPPPEPRGGPHPRVAPGPRPLRHQGAVPCRASKDDFYQQEKRPAARDATLLILINVERYTGPGKYNKAEVLVGVSHEGYNFRWYTDAADIDVAEGEK